MSDEPKVIDEWSVRDLEDNSEIKISVVNTTATHIPHPTTPALQINYLMNTVTFDPFVAEQWAYKAKKAGVTEYLLEDLSWMVHDDQWVKFYLVLGTPLKAKVEVKTRSSKPVIKEYVLPFEITEQ